MPARLWLTRIYASSSVLSTVAIALYEPRSLSHHALAVLSPLGRAVLLGLGGFALLILADVMVPVFKRWRPILYMATALGMLSVSQAMVMATGPTFAIARQLLDATMLIAVCFLDIIYRSRDGPQ